ncbi:ribbon-helix-helix domain-containing protein [Helicobacter cetorum]|uniref:ribbon-helix-helix domain-containing protein n=1 Tax=Helicobacter cetorum TaxID=138563 RepID=UPI000CF1A28D|nr:ribbon-helix-helix domain-containing protein [Helicobacter cetorum]
MKMPYYEDNLSQEQETKTKSRLGRKPKSDASKKTRAVSLYFSDEQYVKLEKIANDEEESVGSYIKRYILKALRKIEQDAHS